MLSECQSINPREGLLVEEYGDFLSEVETTPLNKSFKMVLLETFQAMGGWISPPSISALSEASWKMLGERKELHGDLPEEYRNSASLPQGWQAFWKKNPIAAWTGEFKKGGGGESFFYSVNDCFVSKIVIGKQEEKVFRSLVQELIEFRYAMYQSKQTTSFDGDLDALVNLLLADSLPSSEKDCMALIDAKFRNVLPSGIIEAAATLAAQNRKELAHQIITEFLCEKRDVERTHKILKMRLLFNERSKLKLDRSENEEEDSSNQTISEVAEKLVLVDPRKDATYELGDWQPEIEELTSYVDDDDLRLRAISTQDAIALYVPVDTGAEILWTDKATELSPVEGDFQSTNDDEIVDTRPLVENSPYAMLKSNDQQLIDKVKSLSTEEQDILKYFFDNPGDKAADAKQILDLPLSTINRALSYALSPYLQRDSRGGWHCHSWVAFLVDAISE